MMSSDHYANDGRTQNESKEIYMKRFTFLLPMLVLSSFSAISGTTFDFVVATTNANQTFSFIVDGAQNFDIDWSDGSIHNTIDVGLQSHTYEVAGLYTNRVRDVANAHYMDVLNTNVKVIANYADGKPAAVRGQFGKGTFYYFAFNPMVSDILAKDNNWQGFMATILEDNNIAMDNRIWQFHVDGE